MPPHLTSHSLPASPQLRSCLNSHCLPAGDVPPPAAASTPITCLQAVCPPLLLPQLPLPACRRCAPPCSCLTSHCLPAGGVPPPAAAAARAAPSNPVDLLSDLLSDAYITPSSTSAATPTPALGLAYGAVAFAAAPPPAPASLPAASGPGLGSWTSGAAFPAASTLPPPTSTTPAAVAAPPAYDPWAAAGSSSGFGDDAFAPTPAPAPVFDPPCVTGDLNQWYVNLLTKERGILYEDQYLQVRGAHGVCVTVRVCDCHCVCNCVWL